MYIERSACIRTANDIGIALIRPNILCAGDSSPFPSGKSDFHGGDDSPVINDNEGAACEIHFFMSSKIFSSPN